ncbi:Sensory box/GGDEF family protein [hydrothermal vent metagenome]|uniref:Sensory box/GGDEF family protein n=1 Tax=hydrothermal vent metagenome TaxID=652676 RepID=A0A1W1C6Q2_9ZZZZ
MKNMQVLLGTLLSKEIFHYFQIDKDFNVRSYSYYIEKYFPQSQQIMSTDVREYLPELVGSEEEIAEIFINPNQKYTLEKVYKNAYYINLSIEYSDEESLIIIIQDHTSLVKKQHELLQYSNELSLINSILENIFDQGESFMFVTDNEDIKFANKKFMALFEKIDIKEIQESKLTLYKDYHKACTNYDEMMHEIIKDKHSITINHKIFEIAVQALDLSHKLFTLTPIHHTFDNA